MVLVHYDGNNPISVVSDIPTDLSGYISTTGTPIFEIVAIQNGDIESASIQSNTWLQATLGMYKRWSKIKLSVHTTQNPAREYFECNVFYLTPVDYIPTAYYTSNTLLLNTPTEIIHDHFQKNDGTPLFWNTNNHYVMIQCDKDITWTYGITGTNTLFTFTYTGAGTTLRTYVTIKLYTRNSSTVHVATKSLLVDTTPPGPSGSTHQQFT